MGKPKAQSKKHKKGGVDFKKIKRKIGRKLPPPKNATNTEIKSKAIVLPEQSIVAEKAGLAVSKKGLTLKELLQQTSHHNAKVRKDALFGIKDILLNHPVELKLHKLAVIEKLRERIADDDKLVRVKLLELFKLVIFPGCGKDNQGPLVSLMMAYIFNAMTQLSIDVRLMAFQFFDLVVQFYPSSFSLYAEKDIPASEILHAFEPVVGKEPIGLNDIIKPIKDLLPILVGCFQDFMPWLHSSSQLDSQSRDCLQLILQSIDLVVRFLTSGVCESDQLISPMILKKLWDVFPLNLVHHLSGKDDDRIFMLNTVITKIFLQLRNWDYAPSALLEKFLEFIESSLITKVQSSKVFHEKLLPLIAYIPKLTTQISGEWRSRILMAFTDVFKNSRPESAMKLACLSAVEEMLDPERSSLYFDANDPTFLDYQIAWIQYLPSLLILLDDKSPSCSKSVLHLQLRVAQAAPVNSPFSLEFDNLQYNFRAICYGPFTRLTADIQELAICCLYYISSMDALLLQSLVSCCLCEDVEPYLVVRIIEVLQSAFRAGHIQVADYISFHVTLLSRFQVYPEKVDPAVKSNWTTFKSVTSIACSCLSQIGDDHLVFQMVEKIIVDQICGEIPMDNICAFLRLLVTLDSKQARLSDQSIVNISHVSSSLGSPHHVHMPVDRSTTICVVGSVLFHMYKDVKIRKTLLSCKIETETMLRNLLNLLSPEGTNLTLEERHKIQTAYDRLRAITNNEVAGHS
ncbi:testis-expressed sequence 10 protein [Phtheirospermum japonicum]|uniref:Testis-expressed sequence 10 protein n=1 Tax=Phtheirospermum japonicum TaxID=374723 RepID=A0A830BQY8_9LAMI|nr:testis-expressed sequence 10 protein [Phtheirospermum japonicum]